VGSSASAGTLCGAGNFSSGGTAECQRCTAGFYCPTPTAGLTTCP
jgi:hypothetical protein